MAGVHARPVAAQTSTTSAALKAAFLYNFAKLTEWPAEALRPGQRLELCVADEREVADALEQIIRSRAPEGHELEVQVLESEAQVRSCHVLYVGAHDGKRLAQLTDAARDAPVLVVSCAEHFAEWGGIVQLIEEKERMRFAINVTAAARARLTLSSKLLSLAQIIKEQPRAVRR